jgi:hypothetical protein
MTIEVFILMTTVTTIIAFAWAYIIDKHHNDNNGK